MAHQRRHAVAPPALAAREGAASTTASKPGTRPGKAWSKNRITIPTTSNSGAPTACAPASIWARCGPRCRWARPWARTWPATPTCSRKGTRGRRARAVRRRVLHPADPLEGPAGQEPPGNEEHGRRLFARGRGPVAKGRPEVSVRPRLPGRRRAGLVDGPGLRRGPGAGPPQGRQPFAGGAQVQSQADLSGHANPQRPSYACGDEGGLLLCTWPKGGELSLPFVYSNEVWTGIEYQVASHLMLLGPGRRRGWRSFAPAATVTTGACAIRSTSTNAATGMPGRCRPTRCCRA